MLPKRKTKMGRVPHRYFDTKEEELNAYMQSDEDMLIIEEEAPVLLSLNKEEGFSLPVNYFSKLYPQLISKVTVEKSIAPVKQMWSMKRILAYAAVSVGIMFAILRFTNQTQESTWVESYAALEEQLEYDVVYDYLLENIDNIELESIYADAELNFDVDKQEFLDEEIDYFLDQYTDEFDETDLENLY